MRDLLSFPSLLKRLLLGAGFVLGVVLVCLFASRLAVQEMFSGIAAQRSSGLSAMLSFTPGAFQLGAGNASIARSAEVESHTTAFDRSAAKLRQIVAAHHGDFEDLRTENRSGQGRALAAAFSVPATEFDATLGEVKTLGRVQRISEASEDSSVRVARLDRQVSAARNNLVRLQSLQHEHKAGIQGQEKVIIQDALALQKEIARATEDLAQVENEQQNVLSTVSRAAVHFVLLEEFRASLDVDIAGAAFQLRNSLFLGLGAILSSLAIFLGAVFEYGLPITFWAALLYFPVRLAWKRLKVSRLKQPTLAPAP